MLPKPRSCSQKHRLGFLWFRVAGFASPNCNGKPRKYIFSLVFFRKDKRALRVSKVVWHELLRALLLLTVFVTHSPKACQHWCSDPRTFLNFQGFSVFRSGLRRGIPPPLSPPKRRQAVSSGPSNMQDPQKSASHPKIGPSIFLQKPLQEGRVMLVYAQV